MELSNIFSGIDKNAKVWVYQSDRVLTESETAFINQTSKSFVEAWQSHGIKLLADATVVANVFLIIAVDERQKDASGCSIDASVKYIKSLENELKLDFFNRMIQTFYKDGKVFQLHLNQLDKAASEGLIDENSLVFDPLVKTLEELRNHFLKPVKDSWHARFLLASKN
jgi:hypothetical protein